MSGGTRPRAGVRVFIVGVIACVGVIGAGLPDSLSRVQAASVATAPAMARCSALTAVPLFTHARMHEATSAIGMRPALPEHCEVLGSLRDSEFHVRLPTVWNGGFFVQVGGDETEVSVGALRRGYAVLTQDAGSSDRITPIAKALIRACYGKPPERSYYGGYADGGREAIALSHAFPDDYDGILA